MASELTRRDTSDLKLYDPRYPNGYTFTAKIAIPAPVPTGGFFRVGLMYHLSNPATGENLFVEFDAYDNAGVPSCIKDGVTWSAGCPSSRTAVFERYRYWGSNIALSTWTSLSVNSSEVTSILGRYRPDLCASALSVLQVYSAMELNNSWGELQLSMIKLQAN